MEKYLPLGSIVLLNGGQHRAMIVGFCTMDMSSKKKMYDYMGCLYPEGLFTVENIMVFDHKDINKILHVGFSDNEDIAFKNKLQSMASKMCDNDGNIVVSEQELMKIMLNK